MLFTLKLPIQTSLSVPPELTVSCSPGENFPDFRKTSTPQGCVRFDDFWQNFIECQILWRMCSVVFNAFYTEIAYSNFTFCTRSVFWRTTQFQENWHTSGKKWNFVVE